ncbi:MAG: hypothetical protein HUK25_04260, partial [Treponema sp.]|nr:hypothetical protein [Treponema sp.]
MKKIFAVCFVLFTGVVFAQNHSTIPLDDAVYDVIESAEAKGYCAFLYDVKPYSQSYVISVLDEIIDNLENTESEDNSLIAKELEIVKAQKKRFEKQPGFNWKNLEFLYQKDIG